jgi:hypothetical protein
MITNTTALCSTVTRVNNRVKKVEEKYFTYYKFITHSEGSSTNSLLLEVVNIVEHTRFLHICARALSVLFTSLQYPLHSATTSH